MQAAWPRAIRDVRLAEADGTNKHYVGLACDEGQTEQVLDLRSIDLFWPVPLEVFHRLEDGETGFFDAPLDGAGRAPSGLALDQLSEILEMRDLLVSGCGGEILVVALYVGEVQSIELRIQAREVTRGHGSSHRH